MSGLLCVSLSDRAERPFSLHGRHQLQYWGLWVGRTLALSIRFGPAAMLPGKRCCGRLQQNMQPALPASQPITVRSNVRPALPVVRQALICCAMFYPAILRYKSHAAYSVACVVPVRVLLPHAHSITDRSKIFFCFATGRGPVNCTGGL